MNRILSAAVACLLIGWVSSASAATVIPAVHKNANGNAYMHYGCLACEDGTPLDFTSVPVAGIVEAWITTVTYGLTFQTFRIENAAPFTNVRFVNIWSNTVLGQTDSAGVFSIAAPWEMIGNYGRLTVGFKNFDIAEHAATGLALGVPEPSTWAMMIMGFGLVGSAARRQARANSAKSARTSASTAGSV